MAAIIFHGPPGSYKTSSAIWFELLAALRQGRIVITNIEGMKPLSAIEKELDEQFPDGAELWRVSTQNDVGLELMRSYFHWAPIGAQIIIDEVQDVFPTERSFKPEHYDYQHIDTHKSQLNNDWYDTHIKLLENIKPKDLEEADVDDLNQTRFDEHGHIIYPTTLKESFMRHRKYNWDIVVCTPDITQVNMLIRGACEAAFNHSSKDVFGKVIPYFHRRPRIRQHPPKESGLQAKKSDINKFRKVPTDVHKLYKSTSTGKITASGVGDSPLQSPGFILAVIMLSCVLVFFILFLAGVFKPAESGQMDGQQTSQTHQNSSKSPGETESKSHAVPGHSNTAQNHNQARLADLLMMLPHQPKALYLTATNEVYENGQLVNIEMYFEAVTDNGSVYLSANDIRRLGLKVSRADQCRSTLTFGKQSVGVYCEPSNNKS